MAFLFSASGFTGVSMLNRPQENSTPAPISVTAATSPAVVPAAAPPPPAGGGGGGATGTGGVAPPPPAPLVVQGDY